MQLPDKITSIKSIQIKKEILSSDKNFNQFFNQYHNFFVNAGKGFRRHFSLYQFQETIRETVLYAVYTWKGESSLGTYLHSAIRNSLNSLQRNQSDYEPISEEIISNSYDNFYESLEAIPFTSEEKELLKFYLTVKSRVNLSDKTKLSLSYQIYCSRHHLPQQINPIKVSKSLQMKIVSHICPDRAKELLG